MSNKIHAAPIWLNLFVKYEETKQSIPKHSMYGICTYIWLIFMVNVAKCTIHWASGIFTYLLPFNTQKYLNKKTFTNLKLAQPKSANYFFSPKTYSHSANGPWKKKSLNFIFPTKYVIPKGLKFSHWLGEYLSSQKTFKGWLAWLSAENTFICWKDASPPKFNIQGGPPHRSL